MKTGVLIAAAALALPLAAHAEFDYSYLEGGYQRFNPDNFSEDADGLGIRGSAGISRNLNLTGEWSRVDFNNSSADLETWAVGLGLHAPINPQVDVVGNVSYIENNIDFGGGPGGFGFDDNGYRLDLGLRGQITPAFELDGGIRYVDIEDNATSGYLRGLIGSTPIKLLLEAESGDNGDQFLIGARYDF